MDSRLADKWVRVNGELWRASGGEWTRAGIDPSGEWEAWGTGPRCVCEGRLVWRGRWQCQSCHRRGAPRARPERRLQGAAPPPEGARIFRSLSDHNCDTNLKGGAQLPDSNQDWLDHVEWLTSPVRLSVASRLAVRGLGPGGALSPWHRDRMDAQAHRFSRIASCGSETGLEWHDRETGQAFPHRQRCGQWRVCPRCRSDRQRRLTAGVRSQRLLAMRRLARERGRRYAGREGRWSERLVTLTVPHSGDLPRDVRALVEAWRAIEAPWRRHLKGRGATQGQAYVRAIEITEGLERDGHAHMHVWLVGPYVEHALLRAWWGAALESQGYTVPRRPLEEVLRDPETGERRARDTRTATWLKRYRRSGVPWPVVDVRRGSDQAAYATKVGVARYVVKADGEIERLDPEVGARIWEALEGRRAVQWARGWAPHRERSERWHLRRVGQATSIQHTVFSAIRDDTSRNITTDVARDMVGERREGAEKGLTWHDVDISDGGSSAGPPIAGP